MQTVHSRDGLEQIVALEMLVDVENRITGLIKTRQQLVYDDQDIRRTVSAEPINDICLIGVSIIANIHLPPGLHLWCLCIIGVVVTLTTVRGRDHHRAGHHACLIKCFLVSDCRHLAVGRQLRLQAEFQLGKVLREMDRNVIGDQVNAIGCTVYLSTAGIFLLQVRLLTIG